MMIRGAVTTEGAGAVRTWGCRVDVVENDRPGVDFLVVRRPARLPINHPVFPAALAHGWQNLDHTGDEVAVRNGRDADGPPTHEVLVEGLPVRLADVPKRERWRVEPESLFKRPRRRTGLVVGSVGVVLRLRRRLRALVFRHEG